MYVSQLADRCHKAVWLSRSSHLDSLLPTSSGHFGAGEGACACDVISLKQDSGCGHQFCLAQEQRTCLFFNFMVEERFTNLTVYHPGRNRLGQQR